MSYYYYDYLKYYNYYYYYYLFKYSTLKLLILLFWRLMFINPFILNKDVISDIPVLSACKSRKWISEDNASIFFIELLEISRYLTINNLERPIKLFIL